MKLLITLDKNFNQILKQPQDILIMLGTGPVHEESNFQSYFQSYFQNCMKNCIYNSSNYKIKDENTLVTPGRNDFNNHTSLFQRLFGYSKFHIINFMRKKYGSENYIKFINGIAFICLGFEPNDESIDFLEEALNLYEDDKKVIFFYKNYLNLNNNRLSRLITDYNENILFIACSSNSFTGFRTWNGVEVITPTIGEIITGTYYNENLVLDVE